MSATFTLEFRQIGDVTVVDVKGGITLDNGSAMFGREIRALSRKAKNKIIINMREVVSVDSSAIGELYSASVSVHNQEGKLKLLNLPHRVRHTLQLMELYQRFEVFDNEEVSIRSFD